MCEREYIFYFTDPAQPRLLPFCKACLATNEIKTDNPQEKAIELWFDNDKSELVLRLRETPVLFDTRARAVCLLVAFVC